MTHFQCSKETLRGLIERVTYHNPENGYCVLKVTLKGKRELVPVIGHTTSVSVGEYMEAEGMWINDRNHGLQFKAQNLRLAPPTTLEGIEKYLASGLIRGIGQVYAKKLVKAFGEKVFDIIEESPEQLMQVDGIGSHRSAQIVKGWEAQKSIRQIMLFLHQYGVSTARAVRIYKTFGETAIEKITKDPYCLAREIRGIGFISADKIAQAIGIEKISPVRARAGLRHILLTGMDEGHCALPVDDLLSQGEQLLEIPCPVLEDALKAELIEGDLVKDTIDEREFIFLKGLYFSEKSIAEQLYRLSTGDPPWPYIDFVKAIPWVEETLAIDLSLSQKQALKSALISKVIIITGGPGVGKTTLIKSLLTVLKAKKLDIALCAPTGRAAKRMSEATGLEAKTIHRLLEFNPQNGGFVKGTDTPLKEKILIVDEVSMVDISIFSALLKSLSPDAALILVGDTDQLPSVGAGQVLKDLIDSNALPVVSLTEIFRQAQESKIITNAHLINKGSMPDLTSPSDLSDFYFIPAEEPEDALMKIIEIVSSRIPKKFGFDPVRDIQVLCPMNRGAIGARTLNVELQQKLNLSQDTSVDRFGFTYRVGDKVMQTQNDYEKEVYNGDIGYVDSINTDTSEIVLSYERRLIAYDFGELDQVTLAYATTIHKAQGSEYPCVIIPVMTQHYPMLSRKLLYTGITRGKNLVILVGQKKAIGMCVKDFKTKQRYTKLKEWLIQENSGLFPTSHG